ncbi:MAG TPA: hypothetical protein VFQ51_14840 [Vicinamibacteria bacterium]|nr:hypothetical protein [Vicinamibacteria bacterium]
MRRTFDLAPMSTAIRWLTIGLLCLPAAFALAAAFAGQRALWVPALLLAIVYALVWLFARPTRFDVDAGAIAIDFPAWTRSVHDVTSARLITVAELRQLLGFPLRIGVGGLWGGFGWLWTSRRGLVEFYISRADGLVLLERRQGRSLLVTPDDPDGFVSTIVPGA